MSGEVTSEWSGRPDGGGLPAEGTSDVAGPEGMSGRPVAMHLVRSQLGAGRLESIDAGYAAAAPGVLAVLTHDDLPAGAMAGGRPVLAHDLITFQGQEVAAVVAETDYLAADAVEQVEVVIGDGEGEAAVAGGEPLAEPWQDDGLTCTLIHQRWHPVPLQTQQCVATPLGDGRVRVRVAVRDPNAIAGSLAAALGLPESAVEVETPVDAGRAATTPDLLNPGHVLTAAAALRTGRAVRWQESRTESLTSGGAQAGFTGHARTVGAPGDPAARLELRLLADVGAYALPFPVESPAESSSAQLPWYGFGQVNVDVAERRSNIPPAAIDGVSILGQVALTELVIATHARAAGTDQTALQDQCADAGSPQAAALLATARAMIGAAEPSGRGRARGAALAPGLAAAVLLDLDADTGEWRVDRVAVATSFALNREARLAMSAGAVDGYGLASMQEISFDEQGNCLAATLMDYIMPSSWEAPPVEFAELPDATQAQPPADTSRLLATAAVAAAARNAVAALVPGLAADPGPLTSGAVWERAASLR